MMNRVGGSKEDIIKGTDQKRLKNKKIISLDILAKTAIVDGKREVRKCKFRIGVSSELEVSQLGFWSGSNLTN